MTLSIGIVTNRNRRFAHPAQVSEPGDRDEELREDAAGSVFVVDRRQGAEADLRPGPEARDQR